MGDRLRQIFYEVGCVRRRGAAETGPTPNDPAALLASRHVPTLALCKGSPNGFAGNDMTRTFGDNGVSLQWLT